MKKIVIIMIVLSLTSLLILGCAYVPPKTPHYIEEDSQDETEDKEKDKNKKKTKTSKLSRYYYRV